MSLSLSGTPAGVQVSGYANRPGKAKQLARAGADAGTNSLGRIIEALNEVRLARHQCRLPLPGAISASRAGRSTSRPAARRGRQKIACSHDALPARSRPTGAGHPHSAVLQRGARR
jgi:hypothetical protein